MPEIDVGAASELAVELQIVFIEGFTDLYSQANGDGELLALEGGVDILTRAIAICAAVWCAQVVTHGQPAEEPREAVLIQGSDLDDVIEAVCAAGGEITHQLGIINAVGARMTRTQVRALEASDDTLRIRSDRKAKVDSRQTVATSVEHSPQPRAMRELCQRTT